MQGPAAHVGECVDFKLFSQGDINLAFMKVWKEESLKPIYLPQVMEMFPNPGAPDTML